MHITLVSTFYYPRLLGGTEHTLQHLAESLSLRGLRVSVISLHGGSKPERFVHNGVECHALPAPHLGQCLDANQRAPATARAFWHILDVYNPAAYRLLVRELRNLKPDLVQTHNLPGWSCAAWTAVRRIGVPQIQVLHDYQLTCPPASRFRNGQNCKGTCIGCKPFSSLRQRFSRQVQHVVANSAYTRQVHLDLGFFSSAKSFDVIYGAVPSKLASTPTRTADVRLRFGYLGRIHPVKGIELLIASFIAANRPDTSLIIAGTGPSAYESELRRQADGRSITFLGHTNSSDFLSAIDVLVVPSLWNEPMGRVVIEAATHGVPVIATIRGGIPELVKDGVTGWLFDPSTQGVLRDIILNLRKEDVRRLVPECLAWGNRFTPNFISRQWISLYEKLLGRINLASTDVSLDVSAAIQSAVL